MNFDYDRTFTLNNYAKIFALGWKENVEFFGLTIDWPFENAIYTLLLAKSVVVSLGVTAMVILFAYPMAYFLAFRVQRHKIMWLIVISIPFWTSYLLRIFAWKVILGFNGVVNSALMYLGLIDEPLSFILYNTTSVVITLTHAWVTFAVLPIYVSLEKMDKSLLEAATDLGDTAIERFFRVTLPLSSPGTVGRGAAGLHSDRRRVCDAAMSSAAPPASWWATTSSRCSASPTTGRWAARSPTS